MIPPVGTIFRLTEVYGVLADSVHLWVTGQMDDGAFRAVDLSTSAVHTLWMTDSLAELIKIIGWKGTGDE